MLFRQLCIRFIELFRKLIFLASLVAIGWVGGYLHGQHQIKQLKKTEQLAKNNNKQEEKEEEKEYFFYINKLLAQVLKQRYGS